MTVSYFLQRDRSNRWMIVNGRDDTLVWAGRCWRDRRVTGSSYMSFASSEEGEQYAAHHL